MNFRILGEVTYEYLIHMTRQIGLGLRIFNLRTPVAESISFVNGCLLLSYIWHCKGHCHWSCDEIKSSNQFVDDSEPIEVNERKWSERFPSRSGEHLSPTSQRFSLSFHLLPYL